MSFRRLPDLLKNDSRIIPGKALRMGALTQGQAWRGSVCRSAAEPRVQPWANLVSGGGRTPRTPLSRSALSQSSYVPQSQRQASQCGLTTSFNPDPLRQASQARSAPVVASSQTGLATPASAGRVNSNVRPQEKYRAGVRGSSHLSATALSVPIECRKELSPALEPGRDEYCQSGENDQNMQYWLTSGEQEQHHM